MGLLYHAVPKQIFLCFDNLSTPFNSMGGFIGYFVRPLSNAVGESVRRSIFFSQCFSSHASFLRLKITCSSCKVKIDGNDSNLIYKNNILKFPHSDWLKAVFL